MKRARSHRSWSSTTARRIGIAALGIGILPLAGCGSLSDKNVVTVAGRQVTVEQFDDIRSALTKTGTIDAFLASGDPSVSNDQQLLQSITILLLADAVSEKVGGTLSSEPGADGTRPIEARLLDRTLSRDPNGKTFSDIVKQLDKGTVQLFWDIIAGLADGINPQYSPISTAEDEGFASLVAAAPELEQLTCFDSLEVPLEERSAAEKLVVANKISSAPGFNSNTCRPITATAAFPADIAEALELGPIGKTSKAIVVRRTDAEQQPGDSDSVFWVRPLGTRKASQLEAAQFLKNFVSRTVSSQNGGSFAGFVSLFAFSKGWVKLNPEYGQLAMESNGIVAIDAGPPNSRSGPQPAQ